MIKSNIIDDDSHFGFDLKKLARKILKKTYKLLKVKTKHKISYIFVDLEKIQQRYNLSRSEEHTSELQSH